MYRKVLLVNVFLVGENSGTGNTVKNILGEYPQDMLMQFCLDETSRDAVTSISNTEHIDSSYNRLISYIRNKRKSSVNAGTPVVNHIAQSVSLRTAVHEFLSGIIDSLPGHMNSIYKKTDAFQPEVIFTCGATITIMRSAVKLSERYNAPVILLLMDDWPQTIYKKSILSLPFRWYALHLLKKCCSLSKQSFAISEAMADKYQSKYKIPFLPMMNPATHISHTAAAGNTECVVFTYAGSLSLNRWQSLLEIAEILCNVNNAGMKNECRLYVPSEYVNERFISMFSAFNAQLLPYVPADKVYEVYESSDVLIFTESFNKATEKFTSLSLSTKIPEYMGAGRPILAYLPGSLYSGRYITERNVGLVSNDKDKLQADIKLLISDAALRRELSNNGIETAEKEHSAKIEQEKFINAVNKQY